MNADLMVESLREERERLHRQATSLVDVAARSGRPMTADERRDYEALRGQITNLNEQVAEAAARAAREREAEEVRAPYGRFLRPATHTTVNDSEFRTFVERGVVSAEMRDLVVGTAGAGGNMVGRSMLAEVYAGLRVSSGLLRSPVRTITTSHGQVLDLPKLATHGTAAAVSEGSALAENDPTFAKVSFNAYKFGQLIQLSRELIDDAEPDVLQAVFTDLGEAVGYAFGPKLITGSGSGEPEGIVTGGTVQVTGGTGVSGAPTADNLIDLYFSVNERFRSQDTACWIMSDSAWKAVSKLKDSTNQYLVIPSMRDGEPDRLLGKAVYVDPHVAAVATNAKSIVFGDVSRGYAVRYAGNLRVERSDDYAFAHDMVTLRGLLRGDGRVTDTNAFSLFQGGTA